MPSKKGWIIGGGIGVAAIVTVGVVAALVLIGAGQSPITAVECGNDLCEFHRGETPTNCSQDCEALPVIKSARVVGKPVFHKRYGDIWMNTWADDDNLYSGFGDGSGLKDCYPYIHSGTKIPLPTWKSREGKGCRMIDKPCENKDDEECPLHARFCNVFPCGTNHCYPPCEWTDAGLVVLKGDPPHFQNCPNQCLVATHVPSGKPPFTLLDQKGERDDKPSSLLFYNGRLYWAGHQNEHEPPGPLNGSLAYSDDYGKTLTKVKCSPWGADSVFAVLMFINMGKNYALNQDGYVYAFGIGQGVFWHSKKVYLTRVPKDAIIEYGKYQYYTGVNSKGQPQWSSKQADAKPVRGIEAFLQASAMYHQGTGRYVFMTALPDGALFEAPKPWGPWTKVASLFLQGDNPHWKLTGYIPGVIAKGAGPKHFYFTIAGEIENYQLYVGKLELKTR